MSRLSSPLTRNSISPVDASAGNARELFDPDEMSGRRLNYKVPFLAAVHVSPLNSAQATNQLVPLTTPDTG